MPHAPQQPCMSTTSDTKTMSIAILPSTPATWLHNPLCSTMTSPVKRPKLSIDTTTSTANFIGKHSTSLRLETLSAISPTIRNTFGNRTAGQKLALNTTDINIHKRRHVATPQEPSDTPDSTAASPLLSNDLLNNICPYNISAHISSILRNGPETKERIRRSLASPRAIAKKVSFRAPLTEEVQNKKYTLAHSDIEPSTPTIPTLDEPEEQMEKSDVREHSQELLQPKTYSSIRRKNPPRDEESGPCLTTPVAGRRKKDRQWQWTLGTADAAINGIGLTSRIQGYAVSQ